jgi:hypothetical protein
VEIRDHILAPAALFSKQKYPLIFCFGITCLVALLITELVRSCDEEAPPLNLEYEMELFCAPKNNCDYQKTDT